jgi:hypothetical protein
VTLRDAQTQPALKSDRPPRGIIPHRYTKAAWAAVLP